VWRARRKRNEKSILIVPVIGVIACFVAVHALVFPCARYLAAVTPSVTVLASASVTRWFRNLELGFGIRG
jgi:hypothetical protein